MNTSATVPATVQAGAAHLNGATDIGDWNLLFEAVRARLVRTVGDHPAEAPAVPQLPASLVQAVVLDCVRALDQLHAALEEERSQRPTP
jgi:hypothetical protein